MNNFFHKVARKLDRLASRYLAPALASGQIHEYLKRPGTKNLHLGCGPNVLPGWLNCDGVPVPGAVYLDCARPFPFSANIFDFIFAEHLIEHMDLPSIEAFLKECCRVLKPGGTVRIVTPNLDAFVRMIDRPGSEETRRYVEWHRDRHGGDFSASPVRAVNSIFYEHGHKFIMNESFLSGLLSGAGFSEMRPCKIGESETETLRRIEMHGKTIGEEINRIESLAMEAGKR